jgi:hypothetical protein
LGVLRRPTRGGAPKIVASPLGLLFTFGGYRILRVAARLASAVLFAGVAGYVHLEALPFLLAGLLGYLLGNALYGLSIFLAGAAVGGLLGFAAGGPAGAVAGDVAGGLMTLLFERPLAILAAASLCAWWLA